MVSQENDHPYVYLPVRFVSAIVLIILVYLQISKFFVRNKWLEGDFSLYTFTNDVMVFSLFIISLIAGFVFWGILSSRASNEQTIRDSPTDRYTAIRPFFVISLFSFVYYLVYDPWITLLVSIELIVMFELFQSVSSDRERGMNVIVDFVVGISMVFIIYGLGWFPATL